MDLVDTMAIDALERWLPNPFDPFRYNPLLSIIEIPVSYWISHSYLTGAATAKLWRHLVNINAI